ncbi:hypothetical protein ACXR2U_23065 [Jatrophihabitans sp. YIM 134969]
MHRRTTRGNRIGLAVLGALLLAGGAALVLAYLDVIPGGSDQTVYPRTVQRFVADQDTWLYWVLGIVSGLLALAFLRWLLVQVRVDRVGRVVVDNDLDEPGAGAGRTVMPAGSATAPVEDDIESLAGVRRARADLAGSPDAPELWVTVHTDCDADLGRIRTGVTDTVVPDARTSWERPDLPAYLTLVVGRRAAQRRDLV